MSTNLEIEFKNLLSQTEYENLFNFFTCDKSMMQSQKNIYFDTVEKELQLIQSALRVRIKNETYELTLKIKDPKGAIEINQMITKADYFQLLKDNVLIDGIVYQELIKLKITPSKLIPLADLTTNRIDFPYKGGRLFLDESFYGEFVDYEVEYEALDYEKGLEVFKNFLVQHKIPLREAEPKIRRAQRAINKKDRMI